MTMSKKTNPWQSGDTRKVNKRKKIVRLTHDEIDDAVTKYLEEGGRIEQLIITSRVFEDIPAHVEDILPVQSESTLSVQNEDILYE